MHSLTRLHKYGYTHIFPLILWSKTSMSDPGTLQCDVMRQLAFRFHKLNKTVNSNTTVTGI